MMNSDLTTVLQNILIFMPAFLIALVVHEYGHAWMATRFGDRTSEWSGRLTLNPVAHMDPFGTILFPMLSIVSGAPIFFGWAKPVPIDPRQFSNYRKGLFWVSFAGPLSNIILGFLTALALVALTKYVPETFAYFESIKQLLVSLLSLNFALAIFNLIPIPPLDGSNIVLAFLNYNATQKYLAIQQYSFFILLFLMFSGALSIIRIPILFMINLALVFGNLVFQLA